MKRASASLLLVCVFLAITAAGQQDLPFRVNRVADRVTIFSPGSYAPEAATAVVTTAKALILIDTGLSPTLAELTKAKIKQELGILFIGDLFHPQYLSSTADPALRSAVPRWIEILGTVLKNENEVKTVIAGHGNVMSRDWLVAQSRYIQDLWNAVLKVKKDGGDARAVAAQYPLEKAFPS